MDPELQRGIAAEVLAALEGNQLELPTLPDIAFKIRKALDDPNVSADQLVNLLSFEPVMSSLIIKAANSAALSNGQSVDSLRPAIARLGYRALYNLVMAATLTKLFQADSIHVSRRLKKLWEHSRLVAANSYVLASKYKHLRPDEAMLAGLVHDIGALPLYIYADRHHLHLSDEALEGLTRKFGGTVGEKLLRQWNFSDEMIEVINGHEDMQRTGNPDRVDYVDIVTIANLQVPVTVKFVDWANVAAIAKLGLSVEDCQNFLVVHEEHLAKVQSMFWIGAPKPQVNSSKFIDAESTRTVSEKSKRAATGLWAKMQRFFLSCF